MKPKSVDNYLKILVGFYLTFATVAGTLKGPVVPPLSILSAMEDVFSLWGRGGFMLFTFLFLIV